MKLVYIFLTFVALVSAKLEIYNYSDIDKALYLNVNLNELVDHFNPQIAEFIVNHGLDPLTLPDTVKKIWMQFPNSTFQTSAEPMIYSADLVLDSGKLQRLSKLERYGEATLIYDNRILKMDVGFAFKNLQGTYNYKLKLAFVFIRGRIIVSTENVRAEISITFNTTNYKLTLTKFKLQSDSRIKVIVENKNGMDWINTAIVNIITPFFQTAIMKSVEEGATNIIQTYFNEINDKITSSFALYRIFINQLLNGV